MANTNKELGAKLTTQLPDLQADCSRDRQMRFAATVIFRVVITALKVYAFLYKLLYFHIHRGYSK